MRAIKFRRSAEVMATHLRKANMSDEREEDIDVV